MRKTAIRKDKRTRLQKCFQQTVLKLYHKKTIDQISINEVCEKVGVPRSSFYYHYDTIRDVLEEIHTDLMKELITNLKSLNLEGLDEKESFIKMFEATFPVVKEYGSFVKAVLIDRKDLCFMVSWANLIQANVQLLSNEPLREKTLDFITILAWADMLTSEVKFTREKGEAIWEAADKFYELRLLLKSK